MSRQILIDEVKLPAPNNLTWVFPVLDGEARRQWLVDSFDLSLWFKEALGRYPASERGDCDTRDDLKANWPQIKDRFYRELEREIQLGTTISVDGVRISSLEWEAVRDLPKEELPPLTEKQRETAGRMKISEEEYARNFLAEERGKTALLAKTERLARFLMEHLKQIAPKATVRSVGLSTAQERFDVEVVEAGTRIPIRVREAVVDDFFEAGSTEAEGRIIRILETAVKYQNRVIQ